VDQAKDEMDRKATMMAMLGDLMLNSHSLNNIEDQKLREFKQLWKAQMNRTEHND
jgi:hypothetical protein